MQPAPPIPPRPDLGPAPIGTARPRRPLVAIALLCSIALAASAVAAVGGRIPPGAGRDGPADHAASFRFLERVDGAPRRWDPCRPISYRIARLGAPTSARTDLREAFDRAAVATGMRFEDAGAASVAPLELATGTIELGVTLGADIWVVWLPHESFVQLLDRFGVRRDAVAIGVPFPGSGSDEGSWIGGLIAIDAGARLRPGFSSTYAQGVVLMHEIGHVLGLAHVRDRTQVMYSGRSPDPWVSRWGVGDLEGLRRLGAGAGCFAPAEPVPSASSSGPD
jgi:hypothetical protein